MEDNPDYGEELSHREVERRNGSRAVDGIEIIL